MYFFGRGFDVHGLHLGIDAFDHFQVADTRVVDFPCAQVDHLPDVILVPAEKLGDHAPLNIVVLEQVLQEFVIVLQFVAVELQISHNYFLYLISRYLLVKPMRS